MCSYTLPCEVCVTQTVNVETMLNTKAVIGNRHSDGRDVKSASLVSNSDCLVINRAGRCHHCSYSGITIGQCVLKLNDGRGEHSLLTVAFLNKRCANNFFI